MAVVATMAMTIGLGSVGAVSGQATVPCPPGAIQVRIAQSTSLAEMEAAADPVLKEKIAAAGFSTTPKPKVVLSDPERIEDDAYRAFVTAVLRELPDLLAATGQCAQARAGQPVMDAVFIHVPMLGLAAETPPDQRARTGGERVTHRLTSPWVIFDRDEVASPPLRAVFIWNERQVLLDQALLAGAPAPANPDTSPLTNGSLQNWIVRYVTDVLQLGGSANEGPALNDLAKTMPPDLFWSMISAKQDAALSYLAKVIPPDLLWSMLSAGQSTRGPFRMEVSNVVDDTLAEISEKNNLLSLQLIENQLIKKSEVKSLESILEPHHLIELNGYRIRKRPFVWPE
jgi:hypothetical protein